MDKGARRGPKKAEAGAGVETGEGAGATGGAVYSPALTGCPGHCRRQESQHWHICPRPPRR